MNNEKRSRSRIAEKILTYFTSEEESEAFVGDMDEFCSEPDRNSILSSVWFWYQILKSAGTLLIQSTIWSFTMFKNYIKTALRNMIRSKTYSLLNISGLAVGIAAFLMIGLYVSYELSYEENHVNAERIYGIIHGYSATTPPALAQALMDDFSEVEAATKLMDSDNIPVTYDEKVFIEDNWIWSDRHLFEVFTIPLASGDEKTAMEKPNSILISENIAEKYFGSENPINKVITCIWRNEEIDLRITGVIKDSPINSYIKGDFYAQIESLESVGLSMNEWNSYYINTFFLLKEGSDPDALEERYPEWLSSKYNDKTGDEKYNIPLKDFHLRTSDLKFHLNPVNEIRLIYLFSAVALIIIIIAGVNYINMSTAQAMKRSREVGIRKVVGAQRGQLIKQFLGESVVMTTLSIIIALFLAYLALPVFNNLVECDKTLTLIDDPELLLLLIGAGLLVGIASGCYPAIFIANFSFAEILKGKSSSTSKNAIVRNILVIGQFAISVFLIISTMVTYEQLNLIRNKKLGFSKDNIVISEFRESAGEKRHALKEELLREPGITEVTFSNQFPMKITMSTNFRYQNLIDPEKNVARSFFAQVDYNYIEAFDLEIVQGRSFDKELDEGKNVYIINESLAKKIGWENPVERQFNIGWSEYRNIPGKIVGVVKDFHNQNMHNTIGPVALWLRTEDANSMSIKINTDDVQGTIASIEKVCNKFSNGKYLFTYEFMDEEYNNMYKSENRMGKTLNSFSVLAIFICCLGLFALASFTVEQKTKEIGVRKVLGASSVVLIKMLSWRFLKWILIANIIAWPGTYYFMNKWLQNFVYRIDLGLDVFLYATFLTVIIAFLTIISRTLKATLTNPIDALRYE